MSPNFELLAALFVHMRRTVHGEPFDMCRQRNWPPHLRARALRRVDDVLCAIVEHAVIIRLQADTDVLVVHLNSSSFHRYGGAETYFVTLATTPEPTVRPPSRMAKRRPSSMAIGAINSTSIDTLSPGMTISVPSGNVTMPVTSVVRK